MKNIIIFSTDRSKVISSQDYNSEFAERLTAQGVPHKVIDLDDANEYWWGDYATGEVRSLNDVPLIEEVAIDEVVNEQILVKYPVHKQLNIIAECLENAGIPLTDDFIAMRNYTKQKITNHNTAVQTYKDNPDVYSFYPKPLPPEDE